MSPPRLLITGSRSWTDRGRLHHELDRAAIHLGFLKVVDLSTAGGHVTRQLLIPEMRLIHGDAEGADRLADTWATLYRPHVVVERYPYPSLLGRRGGPHRNTYMVGLGADLCLAFLTPCTRPTCRREDDHESHGTTKCAELAESFGIETWRVRR